MYTDILVPDLHPGCMHGPLAAARALAANGRGHVHVLVTVDVPAPIPSEWAGLSNEVYTRLHAEARRRAEERRDALTAQFANADVPTDVRIAEAGGLYPQAVTTLQARYADLTVVPTLAAGSPVQDIVHDHFHDLLLNSGGPVLAVPEACTPSLPPKRVVVAWKPTREATRAIRDALPLLRAAESVDVVVIDPRTGEGAHGDEPGADIAAHLARHGVRVNVVSRPSMNFSVAYALLDHARAIGADLLVAGGYGRSRFRELLLGGATRELMQTTHIPVLFAH